MTEKGAEQRGGMKEEKHHLARTKRKENRTRQLTITKMGRKRGRSKKGQERKRAVYRTQNDQKVKKKYPKE